MGGGAKAAWCWFETRRAFSTIDSAGIWLISKILVQRALHADPGLVLPVPSNPRYPALVAVTFTA
jgi:hypothetical protein